MGNLGQHVCRKRDIWENSNVPIVPVTYLLGKNTQKRDMKRDKRRDKRDIFRVAHVPIPGQTGHHPFRGVPDVPVRRACPGWWVA